MQRPQSIALSTFSLLAALFLLSENVHAAPLCGLVPPTATAAVVIPTGTPSGLPASANGTAGDVVATGWYAGWLGATQPPSQISWTKYSAVTFAFACVFRDLGVLHTWNSRGAPLLELPRRILPKSRSTPKALLSCPNLSPRPTTM